MGEVKKLGIQISRTGVTNILKEAGMPKAPQRAESTWDQFLRAHAETLWGCDFVAQRVLTKRGFVTAFLMVFLQVRTRRAYVTRATLAPSDARVEKETAAFLRTVQAEGNTPGIVFRDRDSKFGGGFNGPMRAAGVKVTALPKRSPNLNAHAERFIQTLQDECLHRFIVLGTGHLDRIVARVRRLLQPAAAALTPAALHAQPTCATRDRPAAQASGHPVPGAPGRVSPALLPAGRIRTEVVVDGLRRVW